MENVFSFTSGWRWPYSALVNPSAHFYYPNFIDQTFSRTVCCVGEFRAVLGRTNKNMQNYVMRIGIPISKNEQVI